MIDFHCHLDLYPDPKRVVAECVARTIYVLSVTTTPSAWRGSSTLVDGAPRIRLALGLHPQLAMERKSELSLFEKLLPEAKYVGEIGLDGSDAYKGQWQHQVDVFERILHLCAREGGRVMSIHSRRAAREVLVRLKASPQSGVAILHWFTGTRNELETAIAAGCWFSVGPAMLSSERGRELVLRMPRERVITESDGPFAQYQRRSCVPWDMADAEAIIAKIWDVDRTSVEHQLRENMKRLVAVAA